MKQPIKPIITEQDCQETLKRLETIFDAEPNTTEGDELVILGAMIADYESAQSGDEDGVS